MPVLIETKSVAIRTAQRTDKEALWLIRLRAIREVARHYYSPFELEQWAGSITPEYYDRAFERRELVVADYRGAVIGFGQLDRAHGFIEAIYVSPDCLRRGIGTRLLNALEQAAEEQGAALLRLCSSLNALPFYERAGYKAQMNVKLRLPNGFEIPCIYMEKRLTSPSAAV